MTSNSVAIKVSSLSRKLKELGYLEPNERLYLDTAEVKERNRNYFLGIEKTLDSMLKRSSFISPDRLYLKEVELQVDTIISFLNKLPQMSEYKNCSSCGQEVRIQSRFCRFCGGKSYN